MRPPWGRGRRLGQRRLGRLAGAQAWAALGGGHFWSPDPHPPSLAGLAPHSVKRHCLRGHLEGPLHRRMLVELLQGHLQAGAGLPW